MCLKIGLCAAAPGGPPEGRGNLRTPHALDEWDSRAQRRWGVSGVSPDTILVIPHLKRTSSSILTTTNRKSRQVWILDSVSRLEDIIHLQAYIATGTAPGSKNRGRANRGLVLTEREIKIHKNYFKGCNLFVVDETVQENDPHD